MVRELESDAVYLHGQPETLSLTYLLQRSTTPATFDGISDMVTLDTIFMTDTVGAIKFIATPTGCHGPDDGEKIYSWGCIQLIYLCYPSQTPGLTYRI